MTVELVPPFGGQFIADVVLTGTDNKSWAAGVRVFALYEKIANQWKLVQIQFSTSV